MNERLKTFEEKMKKTIGNLDGELSAIRARQMVVLSIILLMVVLPELKLPLGYKIVLMRSYVMV